MASHSSTVKDTIDLPSLLISQRDSLFRKGILELQNGRLKKNGLILGPGFIIMKDLTVFCAIFVVKLLS